LSDWESVPSPEKAELCCLWAKAGAVCAWESSEKDSTEGASFLKYRQQTSSSACCPLVSGELSGKTLRVRAHIARSIS
jgi:hypothetical protein